MSTTLEIENRSADKKAKELRREGLIPATLYGPEIESQSIQLDAKTFSRVPFVELSRLINLKRDNEDIEVLVKNVQKNFVSGEVQNIEFYKIKKGHKVTTKLGLTFVGTSEAVKMGADLVTVHNEVHIRCLPRHLPYKVEVDITALKTEDDTVTFADLNLGEDVEVLDPPAEIICKAETKKIDHSLVLEKEAEAEAAAAAEGAAAEGEAGAEGAAPTEGAEAPKAE